MTTTEPGTVMRWAEAHSTAEDPATATAEAADRLLAALGDGPAPDLLLAFFTAHHVPGAEALATALKTRIGPACLAGVSGGAVVTTRQEIEAGPALVLAAARLPGVAVRPFVLVPSAWGDAMTDATEFARHTPGVDGAEVVLLLGDPFTLDIERVLGAFAKYAGGVRVIGGLASAGMRPAANALILNDWVAREGGVGIALSGAIRVDIVVSQGCRPIGPPLTVTRAQQNVLIELDGQPALERAEQVLRGLGEREKGMLQNGLYVGRPARGDASGRGDYLIRNLLGADRDQGVIAVGDRVAEREQVRLHVRDGDTAREDLELLLAPQEFDSRAAGALLFSCNGRGRKLFGVPDRDLTTLQRALGGEVPTAGFFCAGEIGPVGARSFLHGHTASIAIVRPRGADDLR